mgnify:CR=1 FL=1
MDPAFQQPGCLPLFSSYKLYPVGPCKWAQRVLGRDHGPSVPGVGFHLCALSDAGCQVQTSAHRPLGARPTQPLCFRAPVGIPGALGRPALQGCGGEVMKQHAWRAPSTGPTVGPSTGRTSHGALCWQAAQEPSQFPTGRGRFSGKFQSHTQTLPQALCMRTRTHM